MCRRYCHVASPSHVLCPPPTPCVVFSDFFTSPYLPPPARWGGERQSQQRETKGEEALALQSRREIRRGPRIQMHRRDSPDIVLLFFTFRNIGEFLLGPSTVRGFSYITSYIAVHVHLRTHRGTRAHRQSGHGKDLFIGGPLPSSLSYKSGCVCQRRARAVARANSTRAKRRILPMSVQHLFSCKNNLRIEKQRETFLSVPLVFDQYENGEHHSFVLAQFTGGEHSPVYTVYRECNKRLPNEP